MLALARPLAREQPGGDRLRGDDACELVGQDGAHEPRALLVRARLHRGEAGERLHERIVDGLLRIGADFAEARHRNVDDPRRHGADRVLADPEPLDDAGPEILHEDVGPGGDAQQRRASRVGLQVEHHRALVAIVVQERGAHAAAPVGRAARVIAAARRLDLDDVGALVAEHHRRQRPPTPSR